MTIAEKLRLMDEIKAKNDEAWKAHAQRKT